MKTRSIAQVIVAEPVFAGLDPAWQETIGGCGRMRRFGPDDLLLRAGEPADEFHLIREGSVALELVDPGRPPLVIATLGPGDLVGASWLFPPYVWTFDARAREATATIGFDAPCLRRKCDEDTAMGYALMQRLAGLYRDRLQATRFQLLDLYGDGDG